MDDSHKYDDMLHLPHPVSQRHSRMSSIDRAAQFSPFAALTGYEDVIAETGRLTEGKPELGEEIRAALDRRLALLTAHIREMPQVRITYFVPDSRKSGGAYAFAAGRVKKLDAYQRLLELTDGRKIPLDDVLVLESPIFPEE